MECYNFTPLKGSFVPKTSQKEWEERDYTPGSWYQAFYPLEALFDRD